MAARVVRACEDLRSAGRVPKGRKEGLVRAEEPVFGGRGGHQPDGATQRRRPGLDLGDAHGVRAGFDLAEGRLVDARRDLDQIDVDRLETGPTTTALVE